MSVVNGPEHWIGPAPADDATLDEVVAWLWGNDDDEPRGCSMCGETTHTERERTEDGEWDEDCVFHPFFDGDDKDLRRPGQAGRPR